MNPIPNPGARNILNSDVEIKGNLKFAGELTFAGQLEGEVQVPRERFILTIKQLCVATSISIPSSCGERSAATFRRSEKIEINHGELFGDVRAAKLIIEEGATFVGRCDVNPNKASAPPLTFSAPPPLPQHRSSPSQ